MTLRTALAALMLVAVVAAAASAQTVGCTAVFEDRAARLNPAQEQAVADAARELAATSDAQVRIRLLASAGGSLDRWAEQQVAACPAWQGADGGRADDLLLVAVSLADRETGTYLGSDLASRLDDSYLGVHDLMSPLLADGDVGPALVVGVEAFEELVAGGALPAAGGDVDAEVGVPTAVAEETDVPWVLATVAVLAVAGLAVAAAQQFRSRRRALAEARAGAEAARSGARTAFYDLDQRWDIVRREAVLARGAVAAHDRVAARLDEELDQATSSLEHTAGSLTIADREADIEAAADRAELVQAAGVWETVRAGVSDTAAEVEVVASVTASVRAAVAEFDERLEAARAAVDRAQQTYADVGADGFRPDRAPLDEAQEAVAEAQRAAAAQRLAEAVHGAADAHARATEASQLARRLPEWRQELLAAREEVGERLRGLEQRIEAARLAVRQLADVYAPSVWTAVADLPVRVADLMARAFLLAHEADAALTMDQQQFTAAASRLETASALADEAARELDGLTDLVDDLNRATRAQRELLARTGAAVREARQTVERHAADISEIYRTAVGRAADQLAEAQDLAAMDPGDPLRVQRRVRSASRTARRVLAGAEEDRAALQRVRADAEVAIEDASAALHRARASGAWLLGEAEELLERARELLAAEPAAAERHAEQADRIARRATRILPSRRHGMVLGGVSGGIPPAVPWVHHHRGGGGESS